MSKRFFSMVSALFVVAIISVAQAEVVIDFGDLAPGEFSSETISLDGLMGNSVIVGDKKIDFALIEATNYDPANVIIRGSASIEGYYGLHFTTPGFSVVTPLFKNLQLVMDITALDPDKWISDVHLSMTGSATEKAIATIGETITPSGDFLQVGIGDGVVLGQQGNGQVIDWVDLAVPVKTIRVTKDITVQAFEVPGTNGGFAHLSAFDQYYSQVPEPATLALIGLGGLAMLKRRRH